jgi:hypothetical protein
MTATMGTMQPLILGAGELIIGHLQCVDRSGPTSTMCRDGIVLVSAIMIAQLAGGMTALECAWAKLSTEPGAGQCRVSGCPSYRARIELSLRLASGSTARCVERANCPTQAKGRLEWATFNFIYLVRSGLYVPAGLEALPGAFRPRGRVCRSRFRTGGRPGGRTFRCRG